MACSNCNKSAPNTKCGCQDQPITAAFNPTPNASCPDPTPCYETIQDTCVKHSLDYGINFFGFWLVNSGGTGYPELPAGASLEQAYQAMSSTSVNPTCLPPTNVHPTYIDKTSIVISWENTGAAYYIVEIADDISGPYTATPNLSVLTYTFTLLNPGTKYYFRVKSNCNGPQSTGAIINVTTSPAL